ncbi:MAG: tetratricopeptide repeat protein [Reichenbachiella sp.]|uniref:tetratricopeptide repeat protein n=1 Tax=Reichenbachiella sp. TaxID=2184521 RepID=UPI003263A04C
MQNLTIAILSASLLFSCAEDTPYHGSKNYQQALKLYKREKYAEVKELTDFILSSTTDASELALTYFLQGYVFHNQDSLELAYNNYKKAKQYFSSLGDELYVSKSANRLGQVFYELESYNNAKDYFNIALTHSKLSRVKKQVINDLYGVGKSNKRLGHYEQALKYLFEARMLGQEIQDLNKFLSIQLEIGLVQQLVGNEQLAIEHNWMAINSATGTKHEDVIKGKAYNNLGDIYFEQEEYKKSKQFLEKSLEHPGLTDVQIAVTFNNLGKLHNKLGNYKLASEYFIRSVKLNQGKVDLEEIVVAFDHVKNMLDIKSNSDSLIHYIGLFTNTVAPILSARERLETKDLRYRLEGLELAENEKASRETIPLWVLVCAIAVLLLFVLFLYFRVRFQLNRRSSDMRKFDEYMKIKQKENAEWMKKIKKDQDMLLS